MSKLISDPLIMILLVSVLTTVITTAFIAVSVRSISFVQKKFVDLIAPAVLSNIKEDLQKKGYPSDISPETVKSLLSFADDGLQKHKETLEYMGKRVETFASQMTGAGAQLGRAGGAN